MKFFGSIPSVVMMSLVLLASAQRSSNNLHRDLGKQKKTSLRQINYFSDIKTFKCFKVHKQMARRHTQKIFN